MISTWVNRFMPKSCLETGAQKRHHLTLKGIGEDETDTLTNQSAD